MQLRQPSTTPSPSPSAQRSRAPSRASAQQVLRRTQSASGQRTPERIEIDDNIKDDTRSEPGTHEDPIETFPEFPTLQQTVHSPQPFPISHKTPVPSWVTGYAEYEEATRAARKLSQMEAGPSGTTHTPTHTQPHSLSQPTEEKIENLQLAMESATQKTLQHEGFAEHIEQVKSTKGAPLFPGNDVIGQTPPTKLLINHLHANEKEVSLYLVDKPNNDTDILPFFGKLADAINLINMRADANERILTHSVAQNNVAETFHSSALKDIELRLALIEKNIWGIKRALFAGKGVQQVPPPPSHSTNDKLDLITRKVSTIEEKVKQANKVAVNPPGPQNKTQKTEGTQGARKKGTEEAMNLPKPTW